MAIETTFRTALWAVLALLLTLSPTAAQECAQERFEDASYTVCTIDPATSDLRLFWKNAEGEPYRTFSNVSVAVGDEGRELVFAINAGMYRSDFSPVEIGRA